MLIYQAFSNGIATEERLGHHQYAIQKVTDNGPVTIAYLILTDNIRSEDYVGVGRAISDLDKHLTGRYRLRDTKNN